MEPFGLQHEAVFGLLIHESRALAHCGSQRRHHRILIGFRHRRIERQAQRFFRIELRLRAMAGLEAQRAVYGCRWTGI